MLSSACLEIVWLWGILGELGVPQIAPTSLHADNTSAIQIVAISVFPEHTKHIEVDCHSIRDVYGAHIISFPHINAALERADVFMKALSRDHHRFMGEKLVLLNHSHQFEGNINSVICDTNCGIRA